MDRLIHMQNRPHWPPLQSRSKRDTTGLMRRGKTHQESDSSAGGKRAAMPADETAVVSLREEDADYQGQTAALPGAQPTSPDLDGSDLQHGLGVLRDGVRTLSASPGVYRMLDRRGDPIYVGKARNLRRRVTNYTQLDRLPNRLRRMVAETKALEIVVTNSEVEALLLESNLIKRFQPRYNVLLRDDKSFPYIMLTGEHDFARITKHRGAHKRKGDYFGPFASAKSVNRTVTALEKAFLLRSCSDSVFENRDRPCLLYQIKRCSAPCVGKIDKAGYDELVREAKAFLFGESRAVQEELAASMQDAAENLQFERAAKLRDRLRALSAVQAHQDVNMQGEIDDADVIAAFDGSGQICVQVFFYRAGRNYGNRAYFPRHDRKQTVADVLGSFIGQFYADKPVPRQILVSHDPDEADLLAEALSHKAERKVRLNRPQRGPKRDVVANAVRNAREALERRQAESSTQRKLLDGVAEAFGLPAAPERIEVYDNSHIQGANAVGAMVVAGPEGFQKNSYRKFNIRRDGASGDDYAMMREVFSRRFSRALKEDPDRDQGQWPDLVLIDGGKGQLSAVRETLTELGIDDVPLVAIAKGPDRNAGREQFFLPDQQPFQMPERDPVLFYLQRLRDEVHRFAIGTHRAKRSAAIKKSPLDDVPGIGPRRKKALLLHFGSARSVSRASVADLLTVEGISEAVAQKIYDHFHQE